MPKRSGTSVVSRALEHLERSQMRELRKGARWHSHTYTLAILVIQFRFYDCYEDPYTQAIQTRPLPCPSPNVPQYIEPVPPAQLPRLWIVDGRNGWDWKQSVLAYLDYRSGSNWRSAPEMLTSNEYAIYARAKFEVNHAWSQPDPPPAYEQAVPKKPPQSVKSAAAGARNSA